MNSNEKARKIIKEQTFMVVATSQGNQPWNTPVYFAYDTNFHLFWHSSPTTQHAENIRQNERVFIVIYDLKTLEGVYFLGKAMELHDKKEVAYGVDILFSRVYQNDAKKKQEIGETEDFLGEAKLRMYTFIPEKVWINSDTKWKGKFVDFRVPIDLFDK